MYYICIHLYNFMNTTGNHLPSSIITKMKYIQLYNVPANIIWVMLGLFCFISMCFHKIPDLVCMAAFFETSCNLTKHCKISHAIAWWQQYCNPVHLNGGQIIWSQKIIRPPDCCQKRINLFRMQKLELLISSLSNADELAF